MLPSLAPSVSPSRIGTQEGAPLGRDAVLQWNGPDVLQQSVGVMLFQQEGQSVASAIESLAMAPPLAAGGPQAPLPISSAMPTSQPNGIKEMMASRAFANPSGRAHALQLATSLARDVGPHDAHGDVPPSLSSRGMAALSAPTDPSSAAALIAHHQDIFRLSPTDIAPHHEALNQATIELTRQVGAHCTEHAMILEYLRRHHSAVANTSRALLLRLQLTIGMYEELRKATDASLLQRFQDSLGDAFAAIGETFHDGGAESGGGGGRRGSFAAGQGRRGSFRGAGAEEGAPGPGATNSVQQTPRGSRRRRSSATSSNKPSPSGVADQGAAQDEAGGQQQQLVSLGDRFLSGPPTRLLRPEIA